MKKSIFLAWLCTFVVVSLIDYLWHAVIFVGFYNKEMVGAAYYVNGTIAPLIPFKVLSAVLLAILFVWVIPQMGGDNSKGTLAWRGGLYGVLSIAYLGLVNHAVVPGWTLPVVCLDTVFGLVAGLVASYIVGYFYRKSVASKSISSAM